MIFRIRMAFGLAILLTLLTSITALAKGDFSFITITGPNLKDDVRVTDPALTSDFFAFADFFRDQTKEPADPGIGYEITRYYVNGKSEVAFDHLHYYPDTGYVYYDGIANGGWSEYDGKWYSAKLEIKPIFEKVLSNQTQSSAPSVQNQSFSSSNPIPSAGIVAIIAGLVVILILAFQFRRFSTWRLR
jgi:hypothetical protein